MQKCNNCDYEIYSDRKRKYCPYCADPKIVLRGRLPDIKLLQTAHCIFCAKVFNLNSYRQSYCEYWCHKKHRNLHEKYFRPLREKITQNSNGVCARCGDDAEKIEVHHIIAVADGGESVEENLIAICMPCHKYLDKKQGDERKRSRMLRNIKRLELTLEDMKKKYNKTHE